MKRKLFVAIALFIAVYTANAQYVEPVIEESPVDELLFIPEEYIEKKVSDIPSVGYNEGGYVNPIVRQLGEIEKVEEYTPASVAYNFISAILNGDKATMIHLSTEQMRNVLCHRYDEFAETLHQPGKLNLFSWNSFPKDYVIVPLLVQSEEENGSVQKVYIACIPNSEINVKGFQDVTRDGETNVKVLVNNYEGRWLVEGFK